MVNVSSSSVTVALVSLLPPLFGSELLDWFGLDSLDWFVSESLVDWLLASDLDTV